MVLAIARWVYFKLLAVALNEGQSYAKIRDCLIQYLYSKLPVVQVYQEETLGCKSMKVGDRVRVIESILVYHHPEHRGQAFDIKGSEGEIIAFANEWKGKAISANLPIYVQFSKKFKAHLRENELEVIS